MIHLYYGEGKGKTTAAIGLAVRFLGNDIPVVFVQFLKSRQAGEVLSLEKLGAKIFRGKAAGKFTFQMSDFEKTETKRISNENLFDALDYCRKMTSKNEKVLLVLDEICAAWNSNLVDKVEIEYLISNVPDTMELVLTGRNPPDLFKKSARYITEMKKEKHPFDTGITARQGVEF